MTTRSSLIDYVDSICTGLPTGAANTTEDSVFNDLPPQDRRHIIQGLLGGADPADLVHKDIEGGQSSEFGPLLDGFANVATIVVAAIEIYQFVSKRKPAPTANDLAEEAEKGQQAKFATKEGPELKDASDVSKGAIFEAIANTPPSAEQLTQFPSREDNAQ